MVYTEICNAVWMYLWVGALLLAVILQCLVFMKKAWKHALELGLRPEQIKKGLNNRNHDQHYADFAGIVSFTFTYAFAGRSASVVEIIDHRICILRNLCSDHSIGVCGRNNEIK